MTRYIDEVFMVLRERVKLDEKWKILICCCLLIGATTGVANVAGLFYNPVCSDLGILRGTFNLQSLIGTAVITATLMMMPKVLQRFSIKRLITFAVVCVSICYFLDSFNNGVVGFFIVNMIRCFCGSFYNSLITFLIINSWFTENNGMATSIMMCCSGAAGAILSPIINKVITNYGWRNGYRTVSAIVLFFCLPIMLYRRNLIAAETDTKTMESNKEETAHYKRDPVSYIVLIIFLITCYSLASFMSHVAGYCEAEGFSAKVGAAALSCNLAGNMVFKLLAGFLGDRFGVRRVNRIVLSAPIFAFLLFLFAKNEMSVYIAGLLSGAANAGAGLSANLIIRDVYGNASFGEIRSATSLFTQPAFSVFTALSGYTYDFTGNYDLILIIFVVFGVIQVLALEILYIRKSKGLVYAKTASAAEV